MLTLFHVRRIVMNVLTSNMNSQKKKKTVLLGMSGGVDSSVAALLLKQQGYNVIGAFLKLYSDTKNKLTGECSYLEERALAMKIAALLDIPLITLDFERAYKAQVINPMFQAYAKGLTPNPDLLCNSLIKFPLLWKAAQKHKADFIATGHYARICKTSQSFQLLAGKDREKDQSYFLTDLSQSDLQHTLFPLGSLTKERVRIIAKQHSFPNWNKHGTVGICFVGQIPMQHFLGQRIKEHPGTVLSPESLIIGTHRGIAYYTIGQKVGEHIGINIKKPRGFDSSRFYIAAKNIKTNELVVAPEGHPALLTRSLVLINFQSINPHEPLPHHNLTVRIRHRGELHHGTLTQKNNRHIFTFATPVEAIAPGQFAVLYHGERVVACGEIRLP